MSAGARDVTMKMNDSYSGRLEPRYLAFLGTITQIRPRLHRYCSRMTGSVLDGEEVVQDALFEAYRKMDQFDDKRPLSPWLFRIAHNHLSIGGQLVERVVDYFHCPWLLEPATCVVTYPS
jgi:hypothetical protein